METITDNMQKHYNYGEQMRRLKKAMDSMFSLEAIFIEYAIIEDRLESILRHSGVFNPERHNKISAKINKVEDLCREKRNAKNKGKVLLSKYISDELITEIRDWKDNRNPLTHALLKKDIHTDDLKNIAIRGQEIVKQLNSKVTSYNRALERYEAKMGGV